MMYRSVILTCEHAGNEVPDRYKFLFEGDAEVLETHRGWDPGAWELAEYLSVYLNAPLFGCHTTRLLIEANRGRNSSELFSQFSDVLPKPDKENLIETFYLPYRNQIQQAIEVSLKPVLHLSIHSFTPVWNNVPRSVDIGILFDPERQSEKIYADLLLSELKNDLPALTICFNEPYKGTDDGITTWLRNYYSSDKYTGIELEVNQKFASDLSHIQDKLAKSIRATLYQQP
jgi:predicted N-formylglutamate amidohydrolase